MMAYYLNENVIYTIGDLSASSFAIWFNSIISVLDAQVI